VTYEDPVTVERIVEQLNDRRSDAVATLEHLRAFQRQVEHERPQLENPQAVSEYLSFFVDFVGRTGDACQRIAGELPAGPTRTHAEELRQMASNAAAEQRRCLLFRDKCINKPLPYERLRPLLNEISVTTRDQLTAFRDLSRAATFIDQLLPVEPPPPPPDRNLDRRALFTRIFKPFEKNS
jgi:hypothetical protein